jgi:hypothetical protein
MRMGMDVDVDVGVDVDADADVDMNLDTGHETIDVTVLRFKTLQNVRRVLKNGASEGCT